jgi:hypothetical protein
MSSNAERIARGGQPAPWEQTFTHPRLGELTFRAEMPTVLQSAAHNVEMDNLLAKLTGDARAGTMLLVAAIAGLKQDPDRGPGKSIMVGLPVVDEDRVEDEGSGQVTVTRLFFDAEAEQDSAFLIEVWTAFSMWRFGVLQEADAVKGSSGEPITSSSDSGTPSGAPIASPSTTPA